MLCSVSILEFKLIMDVLMILLIPCRMEHGRGIDEQNEDLSIVIFQVFDQVIFAIVVKHVESEREREKECAQE